MNSRGIQILAFAVAALSLPACVTVYQLPPSDSSPFDPHQTNVTIVMEDIRQIAQMIEAFAIDNNVYPTPKGEAQVIAGERFFPVNALETSLLPYRRPTSPVDPWGGSFVYWTDERAQLYVLVSGGSDRIIDPETILKAVSAARGKSVFIDGRPSSCLDDDIIFSNGTFFSFPRRSARPCRPERVPKP